MIPRPVAVVFCLAALGPARAGEPAFSAERIRDHVKYLAGDRLEGRGIGTLGEQRTLDYLVEQFTKAGLEPAGKRGTFFQTVPLVGVTPEGRLLGVRVLEHQETQGLGDAIEERRSD